MAGKTTVAGVLILLAGCGGPAPLVVGSKNFTEQLILGEIVAQQLEAKLHKPVRRRLNLGGTLLAHSALVQGQIDVYPEYTGTALTVVLKKPPASDAASALRIVREGYRPLGVEWLDPLGFNNTFAMAVSRETAEREGIRKLSEAGRKKWVLGTGYEFATRPDGLPGLRKAYSLPLAGAPVTMDLGLLYEALDQGKVDIAAGNSTDAQLASGRFVILGDDRRYFPPYEAALAVRSQILSPEVQTALSELSGAISEIVMRRMNSQVTLEKRAIPEVAREFLAARRAASAH